MTARKMNNVSQEELKVHSHFLGFQYAVKKQNRKFDKTQLAVSRAVYALRVDLLETCTTAKVRVS